MQPIDNPDLIWDPASRDVLAWGDVIAYRVDKTDLPSVIDRTAAIRDLKQISTKAPQVIKVAPDDGLHRSDSTVRSNYPKCRDVRSFCSISRATVRSRCFIRSARIRHPLRPPNYRFPVRVREPFGADQIVAVTSGQRMTQLEQALSQLNRRRAAGQMMKMVQRFAPP